MKAVSIAILFALCLFKGHSQATMQAGVSGLPIFDVLKLYPENQISGFAVLGNFGSMITNKLSFGINPYYGQADNYYKTTFFEAREKISLYGLNAYLRYYFINGEKFRVHAMSAGGLGSIRSKTTNLTSGTTNENSYSGNAAFTFILGAGAGYMLNKNIALEFNLPYVYMKDISAPAAPYFQTLVPTFGLQFYWSCASSQKDQNQ